MKQVASPFKMASVPELHRHLGLPKPLHPLVSLIDNSVINIQVNQLPPVLLLDFYKISYKKSEQGKIGYGQSYYDFAEGGMVFTSPNQVMEVNIDDKEHEGISLLFHADFIRNYPLGKNIKNYGFFSYDTNEALHLSEKEKNIVLSILKNVDAELQNPIDDFSQDIVVSHIETLLNYSNRFYKRQFITRRSVNNDVLIQLEQILSAYFDTNDGLPTVEYLAQRVHLSPRYLSDMLRSLTGQNAQQLIHEKLIEKAKEYLAGTGLTVAEIAYQLGFEQPQSFNKLFKRKTSLTPIAYRQSFN